MSIEQNTRVFCDVKACTYSLQVSETNLVKVRFILKAQGWTRRHHQDRQVDICPVCTPTFVPKPDNKGGRPKS